MNKIYQVNESRVLFTELGEEGVIFDLEKNDYFSLNETYCSIFKLIMEKPISQEEIIHKLLEEFEVEKETCEKEVLSVLKELETKKFIHALIDQKNQLI